MVEVERIEPVALRRLLLPAFFVMVFLFKGWLVLPLVMMTFFSLSADLSWSIVLIALFPRPVLTGAGLAIGEG